MEFALPRLRPAWREEANEVRHRGIAKDENAALERFPKAAALAFALCTAATPSWPGDVGQGADLYRRHCASCHGSGGRPVLPGAPDFTRPTALLKSDPALLRTIRDGRNAMPAFQGLLRDREILDVVAHLRTLR